MLFYSTKNILRVALSVATILGLLTQCGEAKTKTLIITSDVHLSSPRGRWPKTTDLYREFVTSLKQNPELLFHVGDFVDNVRVINRKINAGDIPYWENEIELYKSINKLLDSTTVIHTYGPGHDFIGEVSIDYAESYTGIPRRGTYRWGGITLIWFSFDQASFENDKEGPPVLRQNDYTWLDEQLSKTSNALLLWHVPIRTPETFKHGVWPNNSNLTIPKIDKLYSILDKHKERIKAIFNGHIHKPIKSSYKNIPVYLCPFYGSGCHCQLAQTTNMISISPKKCGISSMTIKLNESDDTSLQ